jgi:hypothetical protein
MVIARFWLPVWFATHSSVAIVNSARDTSLLFFDARLYLMATQAWLQGSDPWSVQLAGIYYAAPPPSLLPLAPLAMLPIDVGVAVLASLMIVAAVASVRLLSLPWWWVLFPPLVQCVLSANVHALLLPLILLPAGALAGLLKIYAVVPMALLGRWWALLMLGAALVVSIPVLPWSTFLGNLTLINERLAQQTDDALPTIVLVLAAPAALLAMRIVGRERSAWLAVPALWPSQQYYYGSLAMGARSQLAAAIVAFPIAGSGLLALLALAIAEQRRQRKRDGSPDPARTNGTVTSGTARLDSKA